MQNGTMPALGNSNVVAPTEPGQKSSRPLTPAPPRLTPRKLSWSRKTIPTGAEIVPKVPAEVGKGKTPAIQTVLAEEGEKGGEAAATSACAAKPQDRTTRSLLAPVANTRATPTPSATRITVLMEKSSRPRSLPRCPKELALAA